jgi:hypothetical protein
MVRVSQLRPPHIAFYASKYLPASFMGMLVQSCFFCFLNLAAQLLFVPVQADLRFDIIGSSSRSVFHIQPAYLKRRSELSRLVFYYPAQASTDSPVPAMPLPLQVRRRIFFLSISPPHAISPRTALGLSRHGGAVLGRIVGQSHVHSMRKAHEMAGSRPDWRDQTGAVALAGGKPFPHPSSLPSLQFYFW